MPLLTILLVLLAPNAGATSTHSRADQNRPLLAEHRHRQQPNNRPNSSATFHPAKPAKPSPKPPVPSCAECRRLEQQGLVNVKIYAPDIAVQLAYASNINLLHTKLYFNFNEAYLQPEAARMLARAQQYIRHYNPNLTILVRDAVRPQRVQRQCWQIAQQRGLSHLFMPPSRISMHTYGVAVDVTLVDVRTRRELDFGSAMDDPSYRAAPKREREMLRRGILTQEQYNNRLLLRTAMQKAGFRTISNEWWHFESCTRSEADRRYKAVW